MNDLLLWIERKADKSSPIETCKEYVAIFMLVDMVLILLTAIILRCIGLYDWFMCHNILRSVVLIGLGFLVSTSGFIANTNNSKAITVIFIFLPLVLSLTILQINVFGSIAILIIPVHIFYMMAEEEDDTKLHIIILVGFIIMYLIIIIGLEIKYNNIIIEEAVFAGFVLIYESLANLYVNLSIDATIQDKKSGGSDKMTNQFCMNLNNHPVVTAYHISFSGFLNVLPNLGEFLSDATNEKSR